MYSCWEEAGEEEAGAGAEGEVEDTEEEEGAAWALSWGCTRREKGVGLGG